MSELAFVLCLLGTVYVLAPLQYLAIHRVLPPSTRRISPAEAPAQVALAIAGWNASVGDTDLRLFTVQEIRPGQPGLKNSPELVGHVLHFVDRTAAVHGLDYVTSAGRWQVFITRFPDGQEVVTTNYRRTLTHRHPQVHVARMSGVIDVARLRDLHGAHVTHVMGEQPAASIPGDPELVGFVADHERRTLERQREAGAMVRRGDVYRPTWRGAFLFVWRYIPPLSVVQSVRERALAKKLRSALL